jgi:hypothetical protein
MVVTMKLHDILKDEDDEYYFFTKDDDSLFFYKIKNIVYKIPKKSYIRGIEHKVEPSGLEDIIIYFLYDPIFNFDQIISDNWAKVK